MRYSALLCWGRPRPQTIPKSLDELYPHPQTLGNPKNLGLTVSGIFTAVEINVGF